MRMVITDNDIVYDIIYTFTVYLANAFNSDWN